MTNLLSLLIEAAWPSDVLHEQAGAQDHPSDVRVAQSLVGGVVDAAGGHRRIRLGDLAAGREPHQIFRAGLERGFDDVVLLFGHLRADAGQHEHGVGAGQRFLQRGAVVQIADRGPGVRAQHLARLVGVAHDADRVLPQRLEFLDHRPAGIAGGADYSNRHRRFLPIVGFRSSFISFGVS